MREFEVLWPTIASSEVILCYWVCSLLLSSPSFHLLARSSVAGLGTTVLGLYLSECKTAASAFFSNNCHLVFKVAFMPLCHCSLDFCQHSQTRFTEFWPNEPLHTRVYCTLLHAWNTQFCNGIGNAIWQLSHELSFFYANSAANRWRLGSTI